MKLQLKMIKCLWRHKYKFHMKAVEGDLVFKCKNCGKIWVK